MAGSTNWPSSLDSHTGGNPYGFAEVGNLIYTRLTAAATAAATTLTVASTTGFASRGIVIVGLETITYTGTTSTTFTGCTRAAGGTTAAAYGIGAIVGSAPVAANLNDHSAAIVALETKVGITSSTPTASKVLGADGTGTSSWRQVATADLAASAVTQRGTKVEPSYNDTTASATFVTMLASGIGDEMSVTLTTTGGDLMAFFSGVVGNATSGGVNAMGFSLDGANTTDLMAFTAPSASAYGNHACFYLWTGVSAASHIVRVKWRVNSGTASAYGRTLIVMEFKK